MFNVAVSPGLAVWSERVRKDLQKPSTYRVFYNDWLYPMLGRILFFPFVYLFMAFFFCLLVGEVALPMMAEYEWPRTIAKVREKLDKPGVFKVLFMGNIELLDPRQSGAFTTWDSDRFIEDSYARAVGLVAPDLVLAVGDLFPTTPPESRDEADGILVRFDRMFHLTYSVKYLHKKFVVFLGDYDRRFLAVACQLECTGLVDDLLVKHLLSTPCQLFYTNHLQTKVLVRRFYAEPSEAPDDAKCPGNVTGAHNDVDVVNAAVRIVTQQAPILHSNLAKLKSVAFNVNLMPLDMSDQVRVRDFAPNLVVTSRGQDSGVLFCSNCLSLGAGGLPASPQLEWMPLEPGFEPLTFRLPSPGDGGGRGGPQPHISLPPVSYRAKASWLMFNSPYQTKTGYSFGIIDPSASEMTYFVLWNYDRAAVIKFYGFFISIAIFRIFMALALKLYLNLDALKATLPYGTSRRRMSTGIR